MIDVFVPQTAQSGANDISSQSSGPLGNRSLVRSRNSGEGTTAGARGLMRLAISRSGASSARYWGYISRQAASSSPSRSASRHSARTSTMLGNFFHLHHLAEGAEGAVLNDAHGGHALAEDLRHLAVVQLLDETEDDDLALLVAETEHGLSPPLLIGLALGDGLRVPGKPVIDHRVVELSVALAAAQMADGPVVGDAQQPGDQRAPPGRGE